MLIEVPVPCYPSGYAGRDARDHNPFPRLGFAGLSFTIQRPTWNDVERGARNLSPINIEKLAAALSLSKSKLFEGVEAEG